MLKHVNEEVIEKLKLSIAMKDATLNDWMQGVMDGLENHDDAIRDLKSQVELLTEAIQQLLEQQEASN